MEMETLVRYNFPVKIVVLNNGGIGPGMPEIPENPIFNMKPNSLIYGARYDRMMEAFGGKGFFVEVPKDLKGALDESQAANRPGIRTNFRDGFARDSLLQRRVWSKPVPLS